MNDELDLIKSAIQEYAIDFHNSYKPNYPAPDIRDLILRIQAYTDKAVKEARIAEIEKLQQTIVESDKYQSEVNEQAWAYARVHRLAQDRIKELQEGKE